MNEPEIAGRSPIVQKMAPGEYWWCACGRSASQPFCDGAHKGTGFQPVRFEVTAEQTVAWCACKRSQHKPCCDGTHSTLS